MPANAITIIRSIFAAFTPSKARSIWVFLGLCALTLLVRLPFIHVIDDDEAFYSLVAQRWLLGALPYADSFDVKPPLLFSIFATAQFVFGASLAIIKGIEIAFTIWGAVLLQRLMARQGFFTLSLWAGALFPVLCLAQSGASAANMLILTPFVIAAFSAGLAAMGPTQTPLRHIALAGVMIGLAGMVKQTAVVEALGLGILVVWHFRRHRPILIGFVFVIAAALPLAMFSAYFAVAGQFDAFWQSAVIAAMARGQMGLSFDHMFWGVKLILLLSPLMGLIVLALVTGLRREAVSRLFSGPIFTLAVVWSICAAVGCVFGHSDLRYYGISLIAPLLILSGMCVISLVPSQGWQRYAALAGCAAMVIASAVGLGRDSFSERGHSPGDDYVAARATAAELRRLNLRASDSVLIPRRGLYTDLEAHIVPKARYFHTMHLLCDFPTPVSSPLTEVLAGQPRFFILSEPMQRLTCENPLYQKQIDAVIAARYAPAGVAYGQWSRSVIYEVRPSATLNARPSR